MQDKNRGHYYSVELSRIHYSELSIHLGLSSYIHVRRVFKVYSKTAGMWLTDPTLLFSPMYCVTPPVIPQGAATCE